MMKKLITKIELQFEFVLQKLPQLPQSIKKNIVKYAPEVVIVSGIFTILTSGVIKLFYYPPSISIFKSGFLGYGYLLTIMLDIIAGLVMIFSYKNLKKNLHKGWRLIFYLTILYLLQAIIMLDFTNAFLPIISLYLLGQIKSYFK